MMYLQDVDILLIYSWYLIFWLIFSVYDVLQIKYSAKWVKVSCQVWFLQTLNFFAILLLSQKVASAVGTFGRVLECWDRQTREYVAIKVVRSIHKYREAAMIEIDVLEQLSKNDKGGSQYVIFKYLSKWFISWCSFPLYFTYYCFLVQLRANSDVVWLPQSYMHSKCANWIYCYLSTLCFLLCFSRYISGNYGTAFISFITWIYCLC